MKLYGYDLQCVLTKLVISKTLLLAVYRECQSRELFSDSQDYS